MKTKLFYLILMAFCLTSCMNFFGSSNPPDYINNFYLMDSNGKNIRKYESCYVDHVLIKHFSSNNLYLIQGNTLLDANTNQFIKKFLPDTLNGRYITDANFENIYILNMSHYQKPVIYQMDIQTNMLMNLSDSLLYNKEILSWTLSPDNSTLVLLENHKISLFDIQAKELTEIIQDSLTTIIPPVLMNSDKTYIYYRANGKIVSLRLSDKMIDEISDRGDLNVHNQQNNQFVINNNGLELMEITNNVCSFTRLINYSGDDLTVSMNANASDLLYYYPRERKLFHYDLVSRRSNLVFGAVSRFEISPDGKKALVYSIEDVDK